MISRTTHHSLPLCLIAGEVRRDYVITHDGKAFLDLCGGPAMYAAAGGLLWSSPVGILARIGSDFPSEFFELPEKKGLDTRLIKVIDEPIDLRSFFAYTNPGQFSTSNPVGHFARHEMSFPLALLDYRSPKLQQDDLRTLQQNSPRGSDLPNDHEEVRAIHICAMEYAAQSMLQPAFRDGTRKILTLEANPAYLVPEYWSEVSLLLKGVTAVYIDEVAARKFFQHRAEKPEDMASELLSFGVYCVIMKLEIGGRLIRISGEQGWIKVPDYPSRIVNTHHAHHSFAGGFLVEYIRNNDPLEAAIYGSISESLSREGIKPFYPLDALPGLAERRLGLLRERIERYPDRAL